MVYGIHGLRGPALAVVSCERHLREGTAAHIRSEMIDRQTQNVLDALYRRQEHLTLYSLFYEPGKPVDLIRFTGSYLPVGVQN